jgi:hypothetical protein
MKRMAAAAVSLALVAGAAGQPRYNVEHCVELGPVVPAFFCMSGQHLYGTTGQITGQNGGWSMSSPASAHAPAYDRSILCDFTAFNLYWRSTLTLSGIEPPVTAGSAVLLVNSQPVGTVQSAGSSIQAVFLSSEIMTPIPEVTVSLAWNEDGGCYPDCNGNGSLTIADFGCFQSAFAGGSMYADCTLDGSLTIADFGCFQAAFVQGCP